MDQVTVASGLSWQQILELAGVLISALALFMGAMQLLLSRQTHHLDQRFGKLETAHAESNGRVRDLEREVAELRLGFAKDIAEIREGLATEYVRREDWIRFSTSIEIKLDALWKSFDAVKERLPYARD